MSCSIKKTLRNHFSSMLDSIWQDCDWSEPLSHTVPSGFTQDFFNYSVLTSHPSIWGTIHISAAWDLFTWWVQDILPPRSYPPQNLLYPSPAAPTSSLLFPSVDISPLTWRKESQADQTVLTPQCPGICSTCTWAVPSKHTTRYSHHLDSFPVHMINLCQHSAHVKVFGHFF